MAQTQTAAERKAEFLAAAAQMYEQLEAWYEAHPEASFGEIEAEARWRRRALMGSALATLINGRDSGYQSARPTCAQCGQAMEFEGYRRWGVSGLEGETTLRRAYYVCPHCSGQTFFPPRPEVAAAERPLE
jgi:DNA-directed RNA polymerase subunit RPC12/RpoP